MKSDRLLSILLLLQARGRLTARELAQRLEVSERTILRDLDALSAAGVPVYTERGRLGGISLLDGYRTEATGLTAAEAQALFLFGGRGGPAGLGLDQHLRSAFRKLMAALPEAQRREAVLAETRVVVDPTGWRRGGEETPHLGLIQSATWDSRRVRLRYHSAGAAEAVERVVDPYGLVAKAGVWYLIAAVDAEPRLYRVSRVEAAEAVDQPSQRPPDLDLEALWKELRRRLEVSGPGFPVKVRAVRGSVPRLLRMAAAQLVSPPLTASVEGGSELEVDLEFVAEGAAQAILLGFGTQVVVLEPPALRASMAATALAIAELYRGEQQPGSASRPRR